MLFVLFYGALWSILLWYCMILWYYDAPFIHIKMITWVIHFSINRSSFRKHWHMGKTSRCSVPFILTPRHFSNLGYNKQFLIILSQFNEQALDTKLLTLWNMDILHILPNSRSCGGHIWVKNARFGRKTHFVVIFMAIKPQQHNCTLSHFIRPVDHHIFHHIAQVRVKNYSEHCS